MLLGRRRHLLLLGELEVAVPVQLECCIKVCMLVDILDK